MTDKPQTAPEPPAIEYLRGRRAGLTEAAAWLDDAAGLHVPGTDVWGYLAGAADFMRERAKRYEPK